MATANSWGKGPILNAFSGFFNFGDDLAFDWTNAVEETLSPNRALQPANLLPVSQLHPLTFSHLLPTTTCGQYILYCGGVLRTARSPSAVGSVSLHRCEDQTAAPTYLLDCRAFDIVISPGPSVNECVTATSSTPSTGNHNDSPPESGPLPMDLSFVPARYGYP